VQLVFLLAVPATDAADYLHLLASLARLGQEPERLAQLRNARARKRFWLRSVRSGCGEVEPKRMEQASSALLLQIALCAYGAGGGGEPAGAAAGKDGQPDRFGCATVAALSGSGQG